MAVFFTSDLHLGHEKVAELRGFDSIAAHDRHLVDVWQSTVAPDDTVWVLGDITLGNPIGELVLLSVLNGTKHLVWGNHDQGHPMHRNAHRKAAQYTLLTPSGRAAFASAQAFARRRINGRSVLLSHFPYFGDTPGREHDRHRQYRLQIDESDPLDIIHGHTHGTEVVTEVPMWGAGATPAQPVRQIHVGLDAHGLRLVPLEKVAELLGGAA